MKGLTKKYADKNVYYVQRNLGQWRNAANITDSPVSFYQNSSVWLESVDSRSRDRNLADRNANPRFYH